MQINFKADVDRMSADLAKVRKRAVPIANRQAINRTIDGIKTDVKRDLSGRMNLKQKAIADQIKAFKAASKSKTIAAKLDAKRAKAKNLINYVRKNMRHPGKFNNSTYSKRKGRKYRHPGVKASAWNNTKYYKGSFIAIMPNGKKLVMARQGKDAYPLKSLQGPSVRNQFALPEVQKLMERSARQRFNKELTRAINFQILRAVGAA